MEEYTRPSSYKDFKMPDVTPYDGPTQQYLKIMATLMNLLAGFLMMKITVGMILIGI